MPNINWVSTLPELFYMILNFERKYSTENALVVTYAEWEGSRGKIVAKRLRRTNYYVQNE